MDSKIFTLIDANFNRLREGLRVLEDKERFINSSKELSSFLKEIRHLVGTAYNFISNYHPDLLKSRDPANDVSAHINSKTEMTRESIEQISIANIKRCQESSRVLEEYLKLINIKSSIEIKKVRFKMYEYEKISISL